MLKKWCFDIIFEFSKFQYSTFFFQYFLFSSLFRLQRCFSTSKKFSKSKRRWKWEKMKFSKNDQKNDVSTESWPMVPPPSKSIDWNETDTIRRGIFSSIGKQIRIEILTKEKFEKIHKRDPSEYISHLILKLKLAPGWSRITLWALSKRQNNALRVKVTFRPNLDLWSHPSKSL